MPADSVADRRRSLASARSRQDLHSVCRPSFRIRLTSQTPLSGRPAGDTRLRWQQHVFLDGTDGRFLGNGWSDLRRDFVFQRSHKEVGVRDRALINSCWWNTENRTVDLFGFRLDEVQSLRFDLLDDFRVDVAVDDSWRQENQQLGSGRVGAVVAESLSHDRQVTQPWYFAFQRFIVLGDHAANHDGLAIGHSHNRIRDGRVDDHRFHNVTGRHVGEDGNTTRGQATFFRVHVHEDRAVGSDTRCDFQNDAHTARLDVRCDKVVVNRHAVHNRDFLTHVDTGRKVVSGPNLRPAQDVDRSSSGQRPDQHTDGIRLSREHKASKAQVAILTPQREVAQALRAHH